MKLIDQFIYLASNISSTVSGVNIHIGIVWTANDRLMMTWKFVLFDKIN